MKLSKEELQFIDTYLKNSDVIYTDVRLELTDHVASAIEVELTENPSETFYEVFKRYMIRNKKALLKSVEVQQAKLRDKIIMRFGRGFLAKEVLFLLVLAVFGSNYINLIVFEDYFMEVNAGLFIAAMLYYFIAFHKTKKTSVGKGLMILMFIAYHAMILGKQPFSMYAIIAIMILGYKPYVILKKRIKSRLHINFVYLMNGVITLILLIPFFWISSWSKQFLTDQVVVFNFFFQLIMWYVLFKTLMNYKKELNIKYKVFLK